MAFIHSTSAVAGGEQVLTAPSKVRNVGVIAHVDHEKALVDKLLATALGKSKKQEHRVAKAKG